MVRDPQQVITKGAFKLFSSTYLVSMVKNHQLVQLIIDVIEMETSGELISARYLASA